METPDHILVVDDDPGIRELVTQYLQRQGLQASAAADARPALGMSLLSDLRPAGEGEWKGQIYNRENARHYSALVSLVGKDQLVVRAYVGLPLFGKTQVWRRHEAAQ